MLKSFWEDVRLCRESLETTRPGYMSEFDTDLGNQHCATEDVPAYCSRLVQYVSSYVDAQAPT